MHNEYERLKKEGYTEEQISVMLPQMSKINISSSPMGPGREDKGVTITSKQGESKRTSNIMVGFNRRKLKINNGEYVSLEEISAALSEEVSKDSENKVIVSKKTGKKVTPVEMVSDVAESLKESGLVSIDGISKNAAGYQYHIDGDDKSRIFLVGKQNVKNIQLPNGEYVSTLELQQAISNYVYMKEPEKVVVIPDEPTPEPVKPEPTEPNPVVPAKRTKKKFPYIVALIMAATVAMGAHGIDTTINDTYVIEQTVEADGNIYSTKTEDLTEVKEVTKEVPSTVESSISVGETVHVNEGIHSSNSQNVNARYGKHQEGDYTVQYISFINTNDNSIISVAREPGMSQEQAFEQAIEKSGVPADQIRISMHITNENKTYGWVDDEEVSKIQQEPTIGNDYVLEVVGNQIVPYANYTVSEENFNGTVTLNVDGKNVEVKVVDELGTMLPSGTQVIGSDGETYIVGDMGKQTTTSSTLVDSSTTNKITLSLKHLADNAGLVSAALTSEAVVAALLALKKEKELDQENQELSVGRTI